jgi:hypothetical protein
LIIAARVTKRAAIAKMRILFPARRPHYQNFLSWRKPSTTFRLLPRGSRAHTAPDLAKTTAQISFPDSEIEGELLSLQQRAPVEKQKSGNAMIVVGIIFVLLIGFWPL